MGGQETGQAERRAASVRTQINDDAEEKEWLIADSLKEGSERPEDFGVPDAVPAPVPTPAPVPVPAPALARAPVQAPKTSVVVNPLKGWLEKNKKRY